MKISVARTFLCFAFTSLFACLTLQFSSAQETTISFTQGVGDKISLYENRFNSTGMYGFGVESSTLYYKSGLIHRWYVQSNADNGVSDVMELRSSHLLIGTDKVGIGTTSPDYKLDVNGGIRAKEFFVETGWSDFVFDEGYKLPSLEDVALHIEQFGHLPGVPSADEIQKDGLEMGAAQTLMMQKIEELTLYMIEIKEENVELQNKSDALQFRLLELESQRAL